MTNQQTKHTTETWKEDLVTDEEISSGHGDVSYIMP